MLRSLLTLSLCLTAASMQGPDLVTRMARVSPGTSGLEDVVRVFGEPRGFSLGNQTFTRANLPERYIADYDGFAFSLHGGVVQEIRILTPEYRFRGGIHVGAPVSDIAKQFGEPKAVVAGPPEGEPRSGVIYESAAGRPGLYLRRDLGLGLLLRDGKIAGIGLSRASGVKVKEVPRYDPNSNNPFQVDLRGADLSALDLRERMADLSQAVFDTRTVWPARDRLPEAFDPARILEMGRNPGLGVRSLHKRGITGRGVAIALVDSPMPDSHREYAGRVRSHEYINASPEGEPHFHGSTCTALAAGQTLGVAPEAELYLISSWAGSGREPDITPRAKAFERLLDINSKLPPERRIRAISMSLGWSPQQRGAAEMDATAKKAREQGLLVITSNSEKTHGFAFHGLERQPLADPDAFESFARLKWTPPGNPDRLLVPMCSRTGAGAGSHDEYVFFRVGGWSWSIPYIAGVYALAAQVDPQITPDRFWQIAKKTARRVEGTGAIIDPVALIDALGRKP